MANRKPYRPVATGVNFHPAVMEYLNRLCVEEDCDRSALINRIIREDARRRNTPIHLSHPQETQPAPGRIPRGPRAIQTQSN